jgi:hypothetical protein
LLYGTIHRLISENKICEAENLLFEKLDTGDRNYLTLALDFYQTINRLSDEELEKQNFSRNEIQEGLQQILKKFQVTSIELPEGQKRTAPRSGPFSLSKKSSESWAFSL